MPIITLTTDFGTRDGYVGAMKGVLSRLAPEVRIVDIAHDIPRGDIAHAAWVVATSTGEFPHGTIHVVVVDPGVGGAREEVIGYIPAKPPRGEQFYVGPDNGVFAHMAFGKAWRIDDSELPGPVSPTFHGRDVFAPAAALIARGHEAIFGKTTALTGALPWGPRPRGRGRVVHIDHYGNLITDLPANEASGTVRVIDPAMLSFMRSRDLPEHMLDAIPGPTGTYPIRSTYESVAPGEIVVYVGSAGTIEIGVRDGRADEKLHVTRGVELVRATTPEQMPGQGPYR